MATPNPLAALPPPPPVSKTTIPITGLLVDVYGLAELPRSATAVSCLWLHHPRLRSRHDMADIAARCVAAYYGSFGAAAAAAAAAEGEAGAGAAAPARGLIALAFDQRNHGSREVHKLGTASWRDGNPAHAQDMFGIIAGAVADNVLLLDSVGSYLFHDDDDDDDDDEGAGEEGEAPPKTRRVLDQHLVLGVSLGGHSAWQLLFADERVTAAVPVIGCPDFMSLLQDRARLSRLPTYRDADGGASFLGSRDFPDALVRHCRALDPKALLFGTAPVPAPPAGGDEAARARAALGARLRGKRLLACSGAEDRLVPYRCSEPFLAWLKGAVAAEGGWHRDGGLVVDDRVYPGAGHEFSAAMVGDAVQFVVETVREGPAPGAGAPSQGKGAARI